jgi:hypothetical protein
MSAPSGVVWYMVGFSAIATYRFNNELPVRAVPRGLPMFMRVARVSPVRCKRRQRHGYKRVLDFDVQLSVLHGIVCCTKVLQPGGRQGDCGKEQDNNDESENKPLSPSSFVESDDDQPGSIICVTIYSLRTKFHKSAMGAPSGIVWDMVCPSTSAIYRFNHRTSRALRMHTHVLWNG